MRELRNALEYAAVVGEGPLLVEADLPPEFGEEGTEGEPGATRVNTPPPFCAAVAASPEASRIRRALERAGGNRERAAKALGRSRVTLWRRMKSLGLDAAEE